MMKRKLAAILCVFALSFLMACSPGQNENGGTTATTGTGNPIGSPATDNSPAGSPGNASPGATDPLEPGTDNSAATAPTDVTNDGEEVVVAKMLSITGNTIELSDEDLVSPGIEPQTFTVTVTASTTFAKSGKGESTIEDIETGDVLIIKLDGDIAISVYDYGPIAE
jgi:hypothetical protein